LNGLRRQGSLNLIKCGGKELTDGKVEVNAWRVRDAIQFMACCSRGGKGCGDIGLRDASVGWTSETMDMSLPPLEAFLCGQSPCIKSAFAAYEKHLSHMLIDLDYLSKFYKTRGYISSNNSFPLSGR
jgi:hypothetical protein